MIEDDNELEALRRSVATWRGVSDKYLARALKAEATIERVKNLARYDIYTDDPYRYLMQQEDDGFYLKYADVEGALLPVRET